MPLSETVLVIMFLLAIGMIVAGVFRKLPIPYTVLLVLVGVILTELSGRVHALEPLAHFELTPDIVLFLFLPTLIFESGFNLNARQLIKDIAPVLALAVPALIFSTGVVGLGMWLVLPVELPVALIFGALISATDPVAVVALFKELGTPMRLTVLVEGESLLNDATAIVIFNILVGIALYGGLSFGAAGIAVLEFLKVFLGGLFVGIGFGLVISWIMSRLHAGTSATLVMSMVLAYSSFIVAEHSLHLSGVMAVVGAAVTLGFIGVPRLPESTVEALREVWEFLSMVCNTLLFIMIGMAANLTSMVNNIHYILFAVLLITAARASMIYTLVPSATRVFKLPKVTLGERHIMWWGGLKGGLAIAIVLSIPLELPGRELLLDLTLGVVMFTLLVNAPTIRPLIRMLGINRLTQDEKLALNKSLDRAEKHIDRALEDFRHAGLLSKASYQKILKQLKPVLEQTPVEVPESQKVRRNKLENIQTELKSLNSLYLSGVLPSYTYLDLCGEVTRAKDHIEHPQRRTSNAQAKRMQNPFLRLESSIIGWLREKDWASSLLSRYQNRRLSHHLIKDVAHLLMCDAALKNVREAGFDEAQVKMMEAHYLQRQGIFRANISELRDDFPEFYQNFELQLSSRAVLENILMEVDEEAREGKISAKPKGQIDQRIQQAIASLPLLTAPKHELEAKELVAMVPLFSALSQQAIEEIAAHSRVVNFLTDDTIIAEGEKGDSLYVISFGRVVVTKQKGDEVQVIAELDEGDFFGDKALLGEHVRSATVVALHACGLLRLTRKDVLDIAKQYPEISDKLEAANVARQ
ncbi:MAG: cyclic nucleotide-binding domain-containing protein [Methylococcales bacterium]|nr:cyclic nucleotide-binding domain-containing protein [Methylococcales bacterium]